jgi:hypothetical protein
MGQSEATRLRLDDDELRDELTRGLADSPVGARCVVLKTATQTTYPTTAAVVYHCELVTQMGASEAEGSGNTKTGHAKFVKAYNYGSLVPPVGTYVIGCSVNYGYVFHHT